jgi:ABC-type transporter Mla subunit MlaD
MRARAPDPWIKFLLLLLLVVLLVVVLLLVVFALAHVTPTP